MSNSRDLDRFESGWVIKLFAAIIIAGIVTLAIVAFATGHAIAIGLLTMLIVAGATGLVLERIDSGRKRKPRADSNEDDYWGFRGRPGA